MNLFDEFLTGAKRYPERPALVLGETVYTYQSLLNAAVSLERQIDQRCQLSRVGVLGSHSLEAYAGILGILFSGKSYVPLNPRFPVERTASMINRVKLDMIIVDEASSAILNVLIPLLENPVSFITLSENTIDPNAVITRVAIQDSVVDPAQIETPDCVGDDDLAYIMFTSGSTGVPKGVMISHRNIVSFLASVRNIMTFSHEDRFSQTFDLTFDLSLFDMFVCWRHGAALYVLPYEQRILPAHFIRKHQLSVWFSVPSIAGFLFERKLLRPGSFPTLRWSLFCGEALPIVATEAWAAAAENSTLLNLYGPTELTVSCTWHRWDSEASKAIGRNGVVPIGIALDDMHVLIIDSDGREVSPGEEGELCMSGPQCCPGYFEDPLQTTQRFPQSLNCRPGPWYRTGDRVAEAPNGELIFLGRVDQQVKLQGYRVELGEIEEVLRVASGSSVVAAVVWPENPSKARVYVFLSGTQRESESILNQCRKRLPGYMVPARLVFIEDMPLNANGKIDKRVLASMCAREEN